MNEMSAAPHYLELSMYNEHALHNGGYCVACFHQVHHPQVTTWITEEEDAARTALCPHCARDAVVPESWMGEGTVVVEMLVHWHTCEFGDVTPEMMQHLRCARTDCARL